MENDENPMVIPSWTRLNNATTCNGGHVRINNYRPGLFSDLLLPQCQVSPNFATKSKSNQLGQQLDWLLVLSGHLHFNWFCLFVFAQHQTSEACSLKSALEFPQQNSSILILAANAKDAQHLREIFYPKGFTDRDIVALSGAQIVACHAERSAVEGQCTDDKSKFETRKSWKVRSSHWISGDLSLCLYVYDIMRYIYIYMYKVI